MKRALSTAAAASEVSREAAEETAERARDRAPVDTGALKQSIRVEGDEAKVGGGDVNYAELQDKGSVNNPPTHFWQSSVEDGRQKAQAEHSAILRGGKRGRTR